MKIIDVAEPSKQLKVYFSNGYFQSTDDGDITTVESYKTFDYVRDIPAIRGKRLTDIIDIRPRVSDYTVAESTRSPLEFLGQKTRPHNNVCVQSFARTHRRTVSHYKYPVAQPYQSTQEPK